MERMTGELPVAVPTVVVVGSATGGRTRKQGRVRGCPGGSRAHREARHAAAGAGGGRGSPESEKTPPVLRGEMRSVRSIGASPVRLLVRGERGEGGGAGGGVGLARGGWKRRDIGVRFTVLCGRGDLSACTFSSRDISSLKKKLNIF
jgi:hypothetical protein